MNREAYLKSAYDMIYLIYCLINDKTPEKTRIENLDLSELYQVANHHMLTAATAMALESSGIKDSTFTQAKGKAIRKNAAHDIERAKLFQFFDSHGIWYMPLKGIVMQDYYPIYGMRQMSDNDILFDEKYRADVKKYFEAEGYRVDEYKQKYHDVYMKPPVVNFEMHVSLVGPNQTVLYGYYKNIRERLLKDGEGCGCRFTNEDYYIFMTAHEHKHYEHEGTGLRSVLDTYVFMKKFSDTLDMKYIERELKKIGLLDFERDSRKLAEEIFGHCEITDKNREMLEYILFSGTYGNFDNVVKRKMNGTDNPSKFKYIMRRIFLPLSVLKKYYPVFFEHKIMLPLLPFYRFIKIFTVSRKEVKREIKSLSNYKK